MRSIVSTWFINIGLLLILPSCLGFDQYVSVQTESSFKRHKDEFTKAVSIDPDIIWIQKVKDQESQLLQREDRETLIHSLLQKNAKRAGIDLAVISSQNLKPDQVSYFNDLLPLKEQILQSNFLQETSLKRKSGKINPSIYRSIFETPPIIDSEYSWLAEEYGTPYFLFQGLIVSKKYQLLSSNWKNLYFTLIVNVERGEIVYREVRAFTTKPAPNHLNGIFYDSFNIIRRLR